MVRVPQHLHSPHVLAAIANVRLLAVLGTACLRKFGEILNQLVEVINAAILLPILIPTKPRRNTREKNTRKEPVKKYITFKTLLNFFSNYNALKNFNSLYSFDFNFNSIIYVIFNLIYLI